MQHGTTTSETEPCRDLSNEVVDNWPKDRPRAGWDDCEMSDKAWNLLWKELEEEGILNRGKA